MPVAACLTNTTNSTIYSPEVEEQWLNFSTRLLLQLTKKSPDYSRTLFDPLTGSEWREKRIDTTYRSVPMTPLFSSQGSSASVLN
jgi:DNA-dependent protein kinase catalytic subunit